MVNSKSNVSNVSGIKEAVLLYSKEGYRKSDNHVIHIMDGQTSNKFDYGQTSGLSENLSIEQHYNKYVPSRISNSIIMEPKTLQKLLMRDDESNIDDNLNMDLSKNADIFNKNRQIYLVQEGHIRNNSKTNCFLSATNDFANFIINNDFLEKKTFEIGINVDIVPVGILCSNKVNCYSKKLCVYII